MNSKTNYSWITLTECLAVQKNKFYSAISLICYFIDLLYEKQVFDVVKHLELFMRLNYWFKHWFWAHDCLVFLTLAVNMDIFTLQSNILHKLFIQWKSELQKGIAGEELMCWFWLNCQPTCIELLFLWNWTFNINTDRTQHCVPVGHIYISK